jgi:tRNA(Ile)-lysidine synthase
LAERFRGHLDEAGLLAGPGLALLAVSGGPDSMALLALAAEVAKERQLDLLVVHADHGIHPQSAEVARQVRLTAHGSLGVDSVVESLALGPDATETSARIARYRFFRRVQKERSARWLVTAHHADDQAETVLLRILRGSAPTGLAGIPAQGPRGLLRPLLPFRHTELVAHARAGGLPVFEDPANADPRHTRSWIRTRVLPLLEERLGARAFDALLSVARHAAADVAAWDAALGALPALDIRASRGRVDVARATLGGYDSSLAVHLLRAAARRAGLMIGPAQATRIVRFAGQAESGKRLELGKGILAEASFDRLLITPRPLPPDPRPLTGEAGETTFGRFTVRWCMDQAPDRLARDGWTTWLSPGALEVRLPAPGSRLLPLGGNGHRMVARLLMEGRVPRADRAGWPVIARDGQPVWIPGVCRGHEAVPAPGTLAVRMDFAPAD